MITLDPDSADLSLLQDRQVAVLGYDAVAAAHALNLRDSGVDVWVGIDPDSASAASAEIEGLAVSLPEEAVQRCDIVLVPDGADVTAAQRLLDEHAEAGDMVIVTSGASAGATAGASPEGDTRHGLNPPAGVDLAMLRTIAGGERVREEYLDGRGSPALVAVARDASGAAWATLTAYAAAMGSLRSGAIVTTVEHETKAMHAAEEQVQRPLLRSVQETFDRLVQEGVEEEVAYLAVVHELKSTVDRLYAGELGGRGAAGQQRDPSTATGRLAQVGARVRSRLSWIR